MLAPPPDFTSSRPLNQQLLDAIRDNPEMLKSNMEWWGKQMRFALQFDRAEIREAFFNEAKHWHDAYKATLEKFEEEHERPR